MKDDARRIGAYIAKTTPTTVGLKVAAQLVGMKSGFASAMAELVPLEIQIQTILNDETVPTIKYPFYLNFGREMWRKKNAGIDGGPLTAEAEVLEVKYKGQGLTGAVLARIALDCFNVVIAP
jgi:hypothetical protein